VASTVAVLSEYDEPYFDERDFAEHDAEEADLEAIPLSPLGSPDEATAGVATVVAPAPAAAPSVRSRRTGLVVALIIVALVVGFGTATLVLDGRDSGSDAAAASVLGGLVLRQSEVPPADLVSLLNQGTDLSIPTLDLCNGTFPSEAARTARRQVALTDGNGGVRISTEAVLYRNVSQSVEAFSELRTVASQCPHTPVVSPVGEGIAITTFRAPPDGAWPKVENVERLAYDFTSTDATDGTAVHSVAVYLRRGRALVGVYFATPDGAQPAVSGRTTIAGIVNLFESRLAAVPSGPIHG
jgi:hypothetical protein